MISPAMPMMAYAMITDVQHNAYEFLRDAYDVIRDAYEFISDA